MSDTPKTDAELSKAKVELRDGRYHYTEPWSGLVSADFARALERELASSRVVPRHDDLLKLAVRYIEMEMKPGPAKTEWVRRAYATLADAPPVERDLSPLAAALTDNALVREIQMQLRPYEPISEEKVREQFEDIRQGIAIYLDDRDLADMLASVAGVPCRFCMGPGSAEGACPQCGKPEASPKKDSP